MKGKILYCLALFAYLLGIPSCSFVNKHYNFHFDDFFHDSEETGSDKASIDEIPIMKQSLVNILNEPNMMPSSQLYKTAVDLWDDNKQIWPYLNSDLAKVNFIWFVVNNDKTDERKFIPWWNDPDLDKTDAKHPFTCEHYSRMLYFNLRDLNDVISQNYVHKRYKLDRIPEKLRLNIREVIIETGKTMIIDGDTLRTDHCMNAVYLEGDIKDSYSWVFIEPQTDNIFLSSDLIDKYDNFTIQPNHNLPVYKRCIDPDEIKDWNGDKSIIFTLDENNEFVYTKEMPAKK